MIYFDFSFNRTGANANSHENSRYTILNSNYLFILSFASIISSDSLDITHSPAGFTVRAEHT